MLTTMTLLLKRHTFGGDYTLGTMFIDGLHLGFICEDKDRKLEEGGEKVPGKTAIPRGKYEVVLSYSNRFKKMMPEVLNVPGFSGIRIHGGNTSEDTEGCPLLGAHLKDNGVYDCAGVNETLKRRLELAKFTNRRVWLEVQ